MSRSNVESKLRDMPMVKIANRIMQGMSPPQGEAHRYPRRWETKEFKGFHYEQSGPNDPVFAVLYDGERIEIPLPGWAYVKGLENLGLATEAFDHHAAPAAPPVEAIGAQQRIAELQAKLSQAEDRALLWEERAKEAYGEIEGNYTAEKEELSQIFHELGMGARDCEQWWPRKFWRRQGAVLARLLAVLSARQGLQQTPEAECEGQTCAACSQ